MSTAWRPSVLTMMLPGLMSRRMIPASCRAWAAVAAWRTSSTTWRT
ncbi:MAG: hypothetical protein U0835_05280 [Isosphaeraceae bacterium]